MLDPYQGLQTALAQWGAAVQAAELHGLVVGLVCGDEEPGDAAAVIDRLDLGEMLGNASANERERIVGALTAASEAALSDQQLGFQPLLPNDEHDLSERVLALLQWSGGFLSGLGLSGFRGDNQADGVDEFLADLGTIAGSSVEALDGDEEGEVAYMELLEFLRMGTLLVHLSVRREATA